MTTATTGTPGCIDDAFQRVLDDPAAADVLRRPALGPELGEAADA